MKLREMPSYGEPARKASRNSGKKDAKAYLAEYDEKHASAVPAEVVAVAEERKKARAEKNWAKSDELREKLKEMGYSVKDSKDGYELIPNA